MSLTEALWVPLQRGVYWTNQPHVQALETWKDLWGAGPAAPSDALTERTRITAHITTTGHILRTALEHTLHSR
ncbi:hypothetical protein [Streptomyces sp. H34-S4]|uniref:hypothetical protein n=1 Tax=Streptomyces sp. H34-S4 TaxID=2996463 RepID=UPI00226D4C37|nr:hypothetical protein [Streptomyces sp. H34-S4]MCY0937342.1 hypothetical protein [Streptomyces sp. H34-S4]